MADCRDYMTLAKLSSRPGVKFKHLGRVSCAPSYISPEEWEAETLHLLVDRGLLSSQRQQELIKSHAKASSEGTCIVYAMFYKEFEHSGRRVYFSVLASEKENWCLFGRTRVTFYLAMWWLYQEKENITAEDQGSSDDSEDENKNKEGSMDNTVPFKEKSFCLFLRWNSEDDRLPTEVQKIPEHLTQTWKKVCPYCPGPTPPQLPESKTVTRHSAFFCSP